MDGFKVHSRKALTSISSNSVQASKKNLKKDDLTAKPLPRPIPFFQSTFDVKTPGRNHVTGPPQQQQQQQQHVGFKQIRQTNKALRDLLPFTPIDPKKAYPFTPIPIGSTLNQGLNGDLDDLMIFLEGMSFGPSPAQSTIIGSEIKAVEVPAAASPNAVAQTENGRHDSMAVNLPSETSLLRDHRDLNVELFNDNWEQPVWGDVTVVEVPTTTDHNNDTNVDLPDNKIWDDHLWDDSMDVMVPSDLTTLRDSCETDPENSEQEEAEQVWNNSMAVYLPPEASSLLEDGDDTLEISKQEWERFDFLHSRSEDVLEDAKNELQRSQQWAAEMKQAVMDWFQQQRALIEQERSMNGLQACNATLTLPSLRTSDEPAQNIQCSKDAELHDELRSLQQDFKAAKALHEKEKDHLNVIIQQQNDKIQDLEQKLAASIKVSKLTHVSSDSVSLKVGNTGRTSKKAHAESSVKPSERTKKPSPPCTTVLVATKKPRTEGSTTSLGRTRRERGDGSLVVNYRNGTHKETHPDGTCVIRFPNGDVQTTSAISGANAYYHASARTIQVRHTDGSQIFEFPNQQVERHFADGRVMVLYPDGSKKRKFPDGTIETTFADGIHVLLERPDGKREVRILDNNIV